MIFCPICKKRFSLNNFFCETCNKNFKDDKDIVCFIKEDLKFDSYFLNYTSHSKKELEKKVYSDNYLINQSLNLIEINKKILKDENLNIADFGVGRGWLMKLLSEKYKSNNYFALDIAKPFLENLVNNSNITKINCNVEYLPIIDHFDLIFASDIAEHVTNFGNLLYSINKSLKMNGRFVLKVPYENFNNNQMSHCEKNNKSMTPHLRSFDKYILKINLEASGFEIKNFHFDGYSFQMPRKIYYKSNLFRFFFNKFQKFYKIKFSKIEDLTLRKNKIWCLPLQPNELIVVCKKKFELNYD